MKRLLMDAALLLVATCLVMGVQHLLFAQTPDPSPRVQFLGWEVIQNAEVHAGVPTRSSVFVDKATGQEVMCFGNADAGSFGCVLTGRKR